MQKAIDGRLHLTQEVAHLHYNDDCEGCAVSVWLSEEEIQRLYGDLAPGLLAASAEEGEYSRRMAICQGCDGLLYGTTCRYSGSLVQILAKQKEGQCPFPYSPRW